MMQIQSLANCTLSELTSTFNEAFSDYIVKFELTEAMVQQRIAGFNFDLSISPGAFFDGILCGFIFHGIGKRNGQPIVWNGGTGVIPAKRGQGITKQLYQHILPILKNQGFERTSLEVIVGNDPAIHVYQKMGFEIVRTFDCYKGEMPLIQLPREYTIASIKKIDWPKLHMMRSWQPSYQNNDPRVELIREDLEILGVFTKDECIAYIIFDKNPESGEIIQYAVRSDHRRRGIGRALFSKAYRQKKAPLKVINADASDEGTKAFFNNIGFEKTISQYEMVRELS